MNSGLRNELTELSVGLAGFTLAFAVTSGLLTAPSTVRGQTATADPYSELPMTMTLTGVVRDFRERSVAGGHPDFEKRPDAGFGHYGYICAEQLDDDKKPVFLSAGRKITRQWRDSEGRPIMPPRDHLEQRETDQAGQIDAATGGAVTSARSLADWFRDVAGVNVSAPLTITLRREPDSPIYTFDDKETREYLDRGGFFPINGELFGNSSGERRNYHFTYELSMNFVFKRGTGQVFTFTGDDDVWVFIDDKLVIDLGGVHAAVSQTIDLDRCAWLENNTQYKLRFFFAERHRTESNFRIDTTLNLLPAPLPTVTALYD